MEMDRLSECYRAKCRPFRDSDREVWIRWYWCQPGAKVYTGVNSFWSAVWWPSRVDLPHLGETLERRWARRQGPAYAGQCPLGLPDWYAEGLPLGVLAGLPPDGSRCCVPGPTSGLVWGGAGVSRSGPGTVGSGGLLLDAQSVQLTAPGQLGSGGLVAGGEGGQLATTTQLGTGGLVAGGEGGQLVSATQLGAGGLVWGAAGVQLVAAGQLGTGGLVWGGAGVQLVEATQFGTGGLVWGGQGSQTAVAGQLGSGGLMAGGAGVQTFGLAQLGAGGLVFGGEGNPNLAMAYPISPAVVALSAVGLSGGTLRVSWTQAGGTTTGNVWRSTTGSPPWTRIALEVTSPYDDTGHSTGDLFYYVVASVSNTGTEGVWSGPVSATAGSYSDLILSTATLYAYWPMDESSGSTMVDAFAAHNGSYVGHFTLHQATGNALQYAVAMSQTATPGQARVPAQSLTGPVSVELWINMVTTSGDQRIICAQAVPGLFVSVNQSGSAGSLWILNSTGSAWLQLAANGTITAGVWHHVVVTYNGTNAAVAWVDGVQQLTVNPGAITALLNETDFSRAYLDAFGTTLNGSISNAAYYTSVLSGATIAAHYARGII